MFCFADHLKSVTYKLLSKQRHVLDDRQSHAPFAVFGELDDRGQNRVLKLAAADHVANLHTRNVGCGYFAHAHFRFSHLVKRRNNVEANLGRIVT